MRKFLFLISILLIFIQPSFAIKIGLQTEVNRSYIGASTEAEIIDCNTNKLIFIMDKMQGYEFKPHRGGIAIKVNGEYQNLNSKQIVIKPEPNGFVSVKNKWYRGHFKIINDNKLYLYEIKFIIINLKKEETV